jgi:hypothetical protein
MPKELRDIDDIPLGNHYLKLDVSTLSETIGNLPDSRIPQRIQRNVGNLHNIPLSKISE